MYMAWYFSNMMAMAHGIHVEFLTGKHMLMLVGFSADCLVTTHVVA